MSINIWMKCNGITHINTLHETAWRIVEAQEITTTRKLVDSFEEQAILEEMIESLNPALSKPYSGFHPLLFMPFKYPPLKHGSRFGKESDQSLWYGCLELNTAMAEKAFYQFNFLRASEANYEMVEIPLTAFSASIKTRRGAKLVEPPFSEYTQIISSPISYEESQRLGEAMRHSGVEAFNYQSARDPNKGNNIALFTPKAFLNKKPNAKSFQSWRCLANDKLIEFIRTSSMRFESQCFTIDQFLIDGLLPFPAN